MSETNETRVPADFPANEPQTATLTLSDDFSASDIEKWRETVEKDLKGADFEKKLVWKTDEGIDVQPLYTRQDLQDLPQVGNLPGFYPYARGTFPLSSVKPAWQIRQDIQLPSPGEVNSGLRDGIARGQTALGIRMDNAVRRGLDGDAPEAAELIGKGGCTMSSINGLRIALADIDLTKYPLTIRSGAAALPTLAMLVALADEREFDRKLITGGFECDPIRVLVKTGTVRGSMDLQYREMAEIVSFCAKECPGIRGVIVNGHPYDSAGASVVQELGYTMGTAAEYLRAMVERGIDANTAALGMMFSYSVSENMFMEIAKLRAARILWAKIVKAFGGDDENAQKMFLHVRTSVRTKAANDPYNNIVRSAVEAFAGAVGGCDSMFVIPFDDPIGPADEFSMRVARNQQLLLQDEAYISRVVDPAGGSYYIETLTDSVARAAWELFQEVEGQGGFVEALKAGTPQKAIADVQARRQKQIAQRRRPIVGVSNYASANEKKIIKKEHNREAFIDKRRQRLARLKSMRKNSAVREKLATLTNIMIEQQVGNALPAAIAASAEGATIGEIIASLTASAEGEPPTVEPLTYMRDSALYENMRTRADAYREKTGDQPKVFLVPTGPLGWRRARADFSHGFFSAAGFEVTEPTGAYKTPDEAAKAMKESGALVAVVCSDDATYPEFVPEFVKALRDTGSKAPVIVAGNPQESIDMLKAAGVDAFVHIKSNVVETLTDLQDRLGIK